MRRFYFAALAISLAIPAAIAQESKYPPVRLPVQMVVTVEARDGTVPPELTRQDVSAIQGDVRIPIKDWVPLRGSNARLDLFVLIDETADATVASQLAEIRLFVRAQPSSTYVGVAYMKNGLVVLSVQPTNDHALAAAAVRFPRGNRGALDSPYWAMNDLIKRWRPTEGRRAILMVTPGIDTFGSFVPSSPYVDSGIDAAERAGIQVFTLDSPGTSQANLSMDQIASGRLYLSKIAGETGGRACYLGLGSELSFAPCLAPLTELFRHQYEATFFVSADGTEMRPISFATGLPNVEILAAAKVRVPIW